MKSWQVVQLTDLHLFGNLQGRLLGLDTYQSFQAVVTQMLAQVNSIDILLATGDLAQDGSSKAYHRLLKELLVLNIPTYWLPGNHDQPQRMAQVLSQGCVSAQKRVLLPPWQIILLDSTIPHEVGGHLPEGELAFLQQCLEEYPDHYALVCLHHHPLSIDCDWMETIGLDNGSQFFEVLQGYPQVRSVLWGHIHQNFEYLYQGLQLLASPSTCIQFKPQTPKFSLDTLLPGYRWLTLHPDGRLDTGVERLLHLGEGQHLEMASKGY